MKVFYYLLLILTFCSEVSLSQWYTQISGTSSDLKGVYFIDSMTGWICGANGTIKKTTNGGLDWYTQFSNTADELKSIQFVDQNIGWAYGDSIVLNTTNGGVNWGVSNFTLGHIVTLQFVNSSVWWLVYRRANYSGILKTTDGGTTWVIQAPGSSGYFAAMYCLDVNQAWITELTGPGILKTIDGGSAWVYYSTDIKGSPTCIRFVDPMTGWVGSNSLSYDISKSTDGGINWFSQIADSGDIFISSLAFPDAYTGYAVTFHESVPPYQADGFIIKTTNGGAYWDVQYREKGKLNSVFFVSPLVGWAVGDGGRVLNTTNGGTPVELLSFTASIVEEKVLLKWSTATETNNKGFEVDRKSRDMSWESLGFIEGSGTTTFAHTYSYIDNDVQPDKYLYRLKQIDFDGSFKYSEEIEIDISDLKIFSLGQNYPNPFNPTTTIKYAIAEAGFVTLEAYSILGERIAQLVNKQQKAGGYEVVFDASRLSSGVYFYKISAGDFSDAKKMLLIK